MKLNFAAMLFLISANAFAAAATKLHPKVGSDGREVSKAQLPDRDAECRDQQKRFADLLKKGLLTCKIANTQLAKIGFEPLSCK